MKLELHHIQIYPIGENGLKFILNDAFFKNHGLDEFCELKDKVFEIETIGANSTVYYRNREFTGVAYIRYITPLLHPLSDLTKPIKIAGYNDGEEFIPVDEIQKITTGEIISYECGWTNPNYKPKEDGMPQMRVIFGDVANGWWDWDFDKPEDLNFGIIELLIKWKFDFANLIGKGLAADINNHLKS